MLIKRLIRENNEKCSDGKIRPVTKWTEVGKQFIMERALDWKLI